MTPNINLPKLLSSASLAVMALAVLGVGRAHAQTAAPTASPSADGSVSEVIVTATRVERKGFIAPTPTTVLGQADLQVGGRTNLQDVLNDLPQETGLWSATAETGNAIGGASFVDLRDLGVNRTLVLINGARPVPTEFTGTTLGFDLNMIPLAMVKRVDVVTGGASASWGSDAVAGVVNIVMDDDLTGFKADIQGGGSTQGLGGDELKFDVAGGANFANDKGHVEGGFEYDHRPGIYPRDATAPGQYTTIANPNYTATNGQAQDLFVKGVVFSNMSPGGLIVSGPLKGTDFGPGGSVGQFQYGQDVSSSYMIGGDPSAFYPTQTTALSSPLTRESFYGRASYDLTGTTVLTADVLFGHSQTATDFFPYESSGNITIAQNNAYLPTNIRTAMIADGLKTITLGRINEDFGDMLDSLEAYTEQFNIGAHGTLFTNWKWDSFLSYGATERSLNFSNEPITANFTNAINAVISPTTGQPVCAIALTTPSTNCVPIDLFGSGSVSSAAKAYILGTSTLDMGLTQFEAAANLRGTPFSSWAGPVSVAMGLEFRKEGTTSHNDPLTAAGAFAYYNVATLANGSYDVGEAYLETVVPLARDLPLLKDLEFDGGVRESDYSTSGFVPSWKVGLVDQVTDEIRLRGAYSRDIRAPNLAELYVKQTENYLNIVDPVTHTTYMVVDYGGGNLNLKPETANTATVGVIYTPNWFPHFNFSLDYYNISIQNAITTLSAQVLLNECAAGETAVCGQITRVGGLITSIAATEINIASYNASGFDVEAEYSADLAAIHVPGTLSVRILATEINTLKENTGSSTVDLAGDITSGSPRVKGTMTVKYDLDPVEFTARARYVGGGAYSKQFTVDVSVPAVTYFDFGVQWKVPLHKNITLYADVDNVANMIKAADYNADYYDVIGRIFDAGCRLSF